MHTTLLDTVTGKRMEAPELNGDVFWWTEGNGTCDCNRAAAMGHEDLQNQAGEQDVCSGHVRFLVVDVHGDLEGRKKVDVIQEANADYPAELIKQYLE